MSFEWLPVTGDIENEEHAEIRVNISDVATNPAKLDTTDWSWTDISGEGENVEELDVEELRLATDYLDDQNYCRAHLSGNEITHKAALDTGWDEFHYITHYGSHNPALETTHKGSYVSNVLSVQKAAHCPTHDGSQWSLHKSTHYPGDYPGNYPGALDGHDVTIKGGNHNPYLKA